MNGKQLEEFIRKLFNLGPNDKITPKQLNYGLSMMDPVKYALSFHTIKGKPLTFEVPDYDTTRAIAHRPWQKEILRDSASDTPDICVIKSRQLGLSEIGVMSIINWLDTHSSQGVKGLYTFPTYRQLQDFYKTRIQPEFTHGYYETLVDPNNMSMNKMKIRDTDLFFRSSSQGSSMEGIDIDACSLDEYDRLNPLAEQSAVQSMSSSRFKCLRRWSTPTVPDYMIHKLYKESDQRMYYHRCTHCGYEQVLDYDKNIKLINPDGIDTISKVVQPGTYGFVCQKCGKPLDRWYNGHWEITSPGSGKRHGYSISQLNAVWVSADMLKQEELRAPSRNFFYNYSLGTPYQDDSNSFLEQDVTSHIGDFYEQPNRGNYSKVVAGIDWGANYHHIVILGIKSSGYIDVIKLLRVKKSVGVEELEKDLNTIIYELDNYRPDLILADIGYSGTYVDKLKAYFGINHVYGVNVKSTKTQGDYNAHFNESDNTVTIDKLAQNLLLMNSLRRGDFRFYRTKGGYLDNYLRLFIEHGKNVVIRAEEEVDSNTRQVEIVLTISRKGDDHFFQACVYAYIAMKKIIQERSGGIKIEPLSFVPEQTDLQKELGTSPTTYDF